MNNYTQNKFQCEKLGMGTWLVSFGFAWDHDKQNKHGSIYAYLNIDYIDKFTNYVGLAYEAWLHHNHAAEAAAV